MTANKSNSLPFDQRFETFNDENRAGLAVMAIKDGVTVFKKGYGLRNLETKEKVDCNTNFRMASISKQFTAMGIAILEEQQKLSTADYIGRYLTELPEYMSNITVDHLLYHLSGLPEYAGLLWSTDKSKPMVTCNDVYDVYKKRQRLKRLPGEKFNYSNGGYSLLALIIENAAGESYPDFMQRHIFTPAEMANTAIITYPSRIRNQAISYSEWPFFKDIDFNTGNALHGEDGVYTSLNDMQGWVRALDTHHLVSAAMTKKIFTSGKNNKGKKIGYGYGWAFEKVQKHKVIVHSGSWVGFNTVILNVPKKKLWIMAYFQ